jgi:hypothetical protein
MPRIRTIKPDFWTDEKIAELPIQSRLVYIATWSYADDYGVLRASMRLLKSQILPYDETIRLDVFTKWIDALINARMLIPFMFKNESYLYVRTFSDHQRIDRKSTPLVPIEDLNKVLDEYSTSPRRAIDAVIVDSNSNSKGIENKFSAPTLDEVIAYFKEYGSSETLAKKAYAHYVEGKWKDSKGVPVKNWKQKVLTNWINSDRDKKVADKPIKSLVV